jgi:hypothetical protein
MPRADDPKVPHDEADPVREALEGFNAEGALDDPDELEPEPSDRRPLNPDSPD